MVRQMIVRQMMEGQMRVRHMSHLQSWYICLSDHKCKQFKTPVQAFSSHIRNAVSINLFSPLLGNIFVDVR